MYNLGCVVDSEAGIHNRVSQNVELVTASWYTHTHTIAPGQTGNTQLFRVPLSARVAVVTKLSSNEVFHLFMIPVLVLSRVHVLI